MYQLRKLQERQRLREMAMVGKFDDFTITVFGGERNISHFHICRGKPESPTWETCVRLDQAQYFHHGSKREVLNSREKDDLVAFLEKPFPRPRFAGTNWEFIVFLWNVNNPQFAIGDDAPMPDYTQLS